MRARPRRWLQASELLRCLAAASVPWFQAPVQRLSEFQEQQPQVWAALRQVRQPALRVPGQEELPPHPWAPAVELRVALPRSMAQHSLAAEYLRPVGVLVPVLSFLLSV